MSSYRIQRMESIMEQLLAEIIVRKFEYDETLITITGVHIDSESDQAIVSVAVLPDEKREIVLRALNARAGDFAFMLIKKMKVKKLPFIMFV